MDNNASALFREGLETEKRMSFKWMQDMDLSDAKEIPTEVQYKSSSIAAEPFKKHLVQETKGFKPQIKKENFERAKKSFGMCNSELPYVMARDDPRPLAQCFRYSAICSSGDVLFMKIETYHQYAIGKMCFSFLHKSSYPSPLLNELKHSIQKFISV
ncbi:unnamed protein product [Amoebophrya sp. A120]|nr:unnamed protein product [Amoebophrya sp. A120]|eukprot:GSA120T00005309001.1